MVFIVPANKKTGIVSMLLLLALTGISPQKASALVFPDTVLKCTSSGR